MTGNWVPSGSVGYAATKAAVNQTRALAKDWSAKGVDVIAPGYIVTEINDDMWDLLIGKKLLADFPRHSAMTAFELDPMILYLVSDARAEVTGSIFTIDDGQTL